MAISIPEAKRGSVTKRFQDTNVLGGFMDETHFGGFAQDHLLSVTQDERDGLLAEVEAARLTVGALAPHSNFSTEIRPLKSIAYEKFTNDATFKAVMANTNYRFAWIRLTNLVALQVYSRRGVEDVPTEEDALIDFALPSDWNVPAEINFVPPIGPIFVTSSSPNLTGLQIRLDGENSQVIIEPPLHVNLIQAMQFGGRYYLRNGCHRVVGALAAGVVELPALVVDAVQPAQVELPPGPGTFNVLYTMGLMRPPLVSDFNGTGSVDISMRERRYGVSVTMQVSQINIGV